ncbi:MAG: class I SAM-dependent methyltransferase, partial [Bacteroidetes bacterium]|nr:class I SAM-dependent methyltransferase [Bacteroidota bacterium]
KGSKVLMGYDVSEGMLGKLKAKYPQAVTHQLTDNHLQGLEDNSCDVIMSTLAIAHIEDIEDALKEWDRVLKHGADIVITDYHPDNLLKGGDRTFVHEGKLVAVKSYVHTFEQLKTIAKKLDWEILYFTERAIDETMKHWYEKKNALHVYEKYKGCAIIYGMHLRKK